VLNYHLSRWLVFHMCFQTRLGRSRVTVEMNKLTRLNQSGKQPRRHPRKQVIKRFNSIVMNSTSLYSTGHRVAWSPVF